MRSKIEYPGVIFKVNEDVVQVKILQKTACADCHAKSMCSLSEMKEKILEIPGKNNDFKEGDDVLVTGAASLGMKAVLLAFLLPLLIMVVLLFLGIRFTGSEMIAAGISVLSLTIYYIVLYFRKDKLTKEFVFTLNRR
ncbi:MAG: SoxR reducing system RseC family protein [Dysgonamonadaceae bacterium]|jgi:sigma-E factor negative regulatory protein RseC|nr:SoxR reducing system RseC family protein [Dysgonamonadaceae bacterium]